MDKSWRILSKYRNQLFGLAIISIIVLHFCQDSKNQNLFTIQYQNILSSVGVEIFAFLSGMGLYFSMASNNGIFFFYKKRLRRIVPTYIIVSSITLVINDVLCDKGGWLKVVKDELFISLITNGMILYWFIGYIMLMYLVYPMFYKILNKEKRTKNYILLLAISFLIILVLKKLNSELYGNIFLVINRIPIFIVGSYYGKKIYDNQSFTFCDNVYITLGIVIFLFNTVISVISGKPLGLIPNTFLKLLIAIPFMLALSVALSKIDSEIVNNVLAWIGSISLELYMIHVSLRLLFEDFGIDTSNILVYSIMILISLLLSLGLKRIMSYFNLKNVSTP